MFNLVKSIFADFIKENGFLIKPVMDDCILFYKNDFGILISYDEREDDLYIDFDLTKYIENKNWPQELQFPLYLNMNSVYGNINIPINNYTDNKQLSLKERLVLKYKQFDFVWSIIVKENNYKEFLSKILLNERIKLKDKNISNNIDSRLEKAHILFKEKEYSKVIELLNPLKDKLKEFDMKILNYCLEKVR